eukprot:gene8495-8677_t
MLILGAGVVAFNCTGIVIPVFWRQQLLVTASMVFLFDICLMPALVDTLLCTSSSQQWTRQLFQAVDSAVHHFGSLMLPLPSILWSQDSSAGPDREQAYTLVLWVQLLLGCMLPTAYGYWWEIRSRAAFYWQLQRSHPGTTASDTLSAALGSMFGTQAINLPRVLVAPSASGVPAFQLILLLSMLQLLAAAVLWNVLALASGFTAGVADGLWTSRWVDWLATDALAGNCIQRDRIPPQHV